MINLEELKAFTLSSRCHHISESGECAIKIIENKDTFQYVESSLVLESIKEMQIRSLTGCNTKMDLLLKELLRSSFDL